MQKLQEHNTYLFTSMENSNLDLSNLSHCFIGNIEIIIMINVFKFVISVPQLATRKLEENKANVMPN